MESKRENQRSKGNFIRRLSSSLEMSTRNLLRNSLAEVSGDKSKIPETGILNEGYDYDASNQLSENSGESGTESLKTFSVEEQMKRNTGLLKEKLSKKITTVAEKPLENEKSISTSTETFIDDAPPRYKTHSALKKFRGTDVMPRKQKTEIELKNFPGRLRKTLFGIQKSSSSQSDETVLNVWTAPPSRLTLLNPVDEQQDDIPQPESRSNATVHRLKRRQKQEIPVKNSFEESISRNVSQKDDEGNKSNEKIKPRVRRKSVIEDSDVKTKPPLNVESIPNVHEVNLESIKDTQKILPESEIKVKRKKKQKQKTEELVKSGVEKRPIKAEKKKRLSETTVATDSQISSSAVVESEDSSQVGEVLGVLVHRVDGIKMHFFISHPVVRVHLFDLNTGNYVNKSEELKSVISYYENESANTKYILPVTTQPFEMKGKQILTPEWNELLIFNESFEYFVHEFPRVVIFFEVLDFVSMNHASADCRYLCLEGGWHRVAWAFLKLLGAGDVKNTGKKVQLQLYYPPKKSWNFLLRNKEHHQLFGWWNDKRKKKYPYTLYVTVKGITVPDVEPGLRSMIPTQAERGKTTLEDFEKALLGVESTEFDKTLESKSSEKQFEVRWNRVPGQLCKIPKKKLHLIDVARRGCFVAKFSHSGRYLACASCDDNEINSILIFDIPTAKLKFQFSSHFGLIYQIVWSPNDVRLVSSSADCTVRIWSLESKKDNTNKILPHPSYVYASAFHPHVPNIIVSGCYDHVVRVWDASTSDYEVKLVQELSQHANMVNAVCFDEEGDSLFTGDGSGIICRWNVNVTRQPNRPAITRDWTLNQEIRCNELKNKVINDIIFHPTGRKIFVSTRDSCIRLIDTRQFTLIHRYQGHVNLLDFIHISVTPCGSYLFSGSEDGCVYVWNTNTGVKVYTYTDLRYKKTVNSVDFHPHEHMLACSAFVDSAPVHVFAFESSKEDFPLYHQVTSPTVDDLKADVRSRRKDEITARPPVTIAIPKIRQRKSKEVLQSQKVLPCIPSSSSTSILKSSTSSDKNRSVTFQDEIDATSNSKWKIVLDKLDSILDKTASSSLDTCTGTTTTSKSQILTDDMSTTATSTTTPTLTSSSTSTQDEFKVVSLYSFCASNNTELSLKPSDVIKVTRQINNHWWEGISQDGRKGIFPSNYVYRVESDCASSTSTPVPAPRRRRKTHAIPSVRGTPVFFSASEDEIQS